MHHAENIPGENRKLIDPDSGLYEYDDLVVLRTAEMPAVLLEAGVVVNRAEELLLRDAVRAQSMARAVAEGLSAGCIGGTRPAAAWSDSPDPRR
jgi:N-acetylmuramoyl-L-alanine amidase